MLNLFKFLIVQIANSLLIISTVTLANLPEKVFKTSYLVVLNFNLNDFKTFWVAWYCMVQPKICQPNIVQGPYSRCSIYFVVM